MYDVVIVGYGPTGMMAAALLGRAGHRVGVFERHKTLYNLPRVGIVHDDVLRMFQEIGCIERVWPSTHFLPVYEMAKNGRVLLSSDVAPMATHGWPEYISLYQPAFEGELDTIVKSLPRVDVFQGERAIAVSQADGHVEIEVEGDAGRRKVRGRYLIGSDGGNSFIREAIGVRYENLGFDQDWLVIDAKAKRSHAHLPPMRQLCEPEQPGVTLHMGPHHQRWSFMVFPGESLDDAVKPENVWQRLDRPEGATPDEFELIRVACYKFQSLYAEQWRRGRVFLAGDSAHQMPPFLAQGMCSGFRDAHNLAWKLDLVLQGKAPPAFLDTYEAERGPNARATIVESMRVGQHVNERDPEKVRQRDEQLMALQAQKQKEKASGKSQLIAFRVPGFSAGLVARPRDGVRGAGDAFPQARVKSNGREARFDDMAGYGFMIIGRNGDPASALSADDRQFWQSLGGRIVRLGSADGELFDTEGQYNRLMDAYGCNVIVKRPDYYLFGACPTPRELPALIDDLRGQLQAIH